MKRSTGIGLQGQERAAHVAGLVELASRGQVDREKRRFAVHRGFSSLAYRPHRIPSS
jgi:hypothetical protein